MGLKNKKVTVLIILLSIFALVAQSCSTAKKGCGCGTDINRAYKAKRFH